MLSSGMALALFSSCLSLPRRDKGTAQARHDLLYTGEGAKSVPFNKGNLQLIGAATTRLHEEMDI